MRYFSTTVSVLLTLLLAGCAGDDLTTNPIATMPARITIAAPVDTLRAGEHATLAAIFYDTVGAAAPDARFTWTSSDSTIAAVTGEGEVTGRRSGRVALRAHSDGVASDSLVLTVLPLVRVGTFIGEIGGTTDVRGHATVTVGADTAATVMLDAEFRTSAGPFLEVFLSPTEKIGAASVSLGKLETLAGAQTYTVPAGIDPAVYEWVVIHCVRYNHTFGYAKLEK